MSQTITLPPGVQEARAKFDQAREEHARIANALRQARADCIEAETAHQLAQVNLATAESNAAMGRTGSVAATRKGFLSARDTLDFAAARVHGLESSATIAADAMEVAKQSLLAAWSVWVSEFGTKLELAREYESARAHFLHVVDKSLMYAEGLHLGRVSAAMRRTVIAGSVDGSANLITRSGPFRSAWRKSPDLMDTYQSIVDIRQRVLGDLEVSAQPLVAASADRDGELSDIPVPVFSRGGLHL